MWIEPLWMRLLIFFAMRKIFLILSLVFAAVASAQTDMQKLQRGLSAVASYDNEYPREVVYVHTDQAAYVQGETLWMKAYVLRASSLTPCPVSRVLYVELVSSEGQVVDRQLLRVSDQGTAEGHMSLELPILEGLYELRAYTREMLNWGEDAIYKQVIPVFTEKFDIELPDVADADTTQISNSTGAMTSESADYGYLLTAGMGVDSMQLCALVVTCRERPCYVDTLTVGGAAGAVQLELDRKVLHDGWNCCQLMTTRGTSLGHTWVWKKPELQRELTVRVRQNKGSYRPFEPVAIEVEVVDSKGKPVPGVQLSMSVSDSEGAMVSTTPRTDFTSTLMQDRGGRNIPFTVMSGTEKFELKQPIEDKLLLRGQVFKDNDKRVPRPHFNLFVSMYSMAGGALRGEARTDANGCFAFTSNEDYVGEWIAQFSTLNDDGRRKWSRVALNRWQKMAPRRWTQKDFNIVDAAMLSPTFARQDSAYQEKPAPSLFHWEDTIPRISRSIALAEAKVSGRGRYKGQRGDRYSFQGGERRGKHFSDKYINIIQALEDWKDQGGANDLLQNFLCDYDPDFVNYDLVYPHVPVDEQSTVQRPNRNVPTDFQVSGLNFYYKGKQAYVFIDNKLSTLGLDMYRNSTWEDIVSYVGLSNADLQGLYWASEIKSVLVMERRDHWWRFLSPAQQRMIQEMPSQIGIFVYTRPEHYRYKGKKGVDMRVINGFQQPKAYPAPSYNGLEPEDKEDFRRTLYWAPNLITDKAGKASVVFFNGARPDMEPTFSLRGISPDGHIVNIEK